MQQILVHNLFTFAAEDDHIKVLLLPLDVLGLGELPQKAENDLPVERINVRGGSVVCTCGRKRGECKRKETILGVQTAQVEQLILEVVGRSDEQRLKWDLGFGSSELLKGCTFVLESMEVVCDEPGVQYVQQRHVLCGWLADSLDLGTIVIVLRGVFDNRSDFVFALEYGIAALGD
jgi:hypothetical protein